MPTEKRMRGLAPEIDEFRRPVDINTAQNYFSGADYYTPVGIYDLRPVAEAVDQESTEWKYIKAAYNGAVSDTVRGGFGVIKSLLEGTVMEREQAGLEVERMKQNIQSIDEMLNDKDAWYAPYEITADSTLDQIGLGIMQGIGQSVPQILLAIASGGTIGVASATSFVGRIMASKTALSYMALNTFGNDYINFRNQGADVNRATKGAAFSAMVQAPMEELGFTSIIRPFTKVVGKVGSTIIGNAMVKATTNTATNLAKRGLSKEIVQTIRNVTRPVTDIIAERIVGKLGVGKLSQELPAGKAFKAQVADILETALTEGWTEFIQEFPEQFAEIYAINPETNTFGEMWEKWEENAGENLMNAFISLLSGAGAGGALRGGGYALNAGSRYVLRASSPKVEWAVQTLEGCIQRGLVRAEQKRAQEKLTNTCEKIKAPEFKNVPPENIRSIVDDKFQGQFVRVDADKIRAYAQEVGVEKVSKALNISPETIQKEAEAGGSFTLTYGQYVAAEKELGSFNEKVKDNTTFISGEDTIDEAKLKRDTKEAYAQHSDKEEADIAISEWLDKEAIPDLEKNGATKDEIDAAKALFPAHAAAFLERTTLPPKEAIERLKKKEFPKFVTDLKKGGYSQVQGRIRQGQENAQSTTQQTLENVQDNIQPGQESVQNIAQQGQENAQGKQQVDVEKLAKEIAPLSNEEKKERLENLTWEERKAYLDFLPLKEKVECLTLLSAGIRNEYLDSLTLEKKVECLILLSVGARKEYLRSLDFGERVECLALFNRKEREEYIDSLTSNELAEERKDGVYIAVNALREWARQNAELYNNYRSLNEAEKEKFNKEVDEIFKKEENTKTKEEIIEELAKKWNIINPRKLIKLGWPPLTVNLVCPEWGDTVLTIAISDLDHIVIEHDFENPIIKNMPKRALNKNGPGRDDNIPILSFGEYLSESISSPAMIFKDRSYDSRINFISTAKDANGHFIKTVYAHQKNNEGRIITMYGLNDPAIKVLNLFLKAIKKKQLLYIDAKKINELLNGIKWQALKEAEYKLKERVKNAALVNQKETNGAISLTDGSKKRTTHNPETTGVNSPTASEPGSSLNSSVTYSQQEVNAKNLSTSAREAVEKIELPLAEKAKLDKFEKILDKKITTIKKEIEELQKTNKVYTLEDLEKTQKEYFIEKSIWRYQEVEGKRLGATSWDEQGRAYIALFQGSNVSTVVHEFGHYAFESTYNLIKDGVATEQTIKDFNTLLKWVGLTFEAYDKMNFEERRECHEKIATAFETYVMEGKAPSTTLAKIFSRLKNLMLKIYKSLTENRGKYYQELNPEVRAVFDRMLACQAEIDVMKRTEGYFSKIPAEIWDTLPDSVKVKLTEYAEKAEQISVDRITKKALEEFNPKRKKAKEEYTKQVREEAAKEVNSQQFYKTLNELGDNHYFPVGSKKAFNSMSFKTMARRYLDPEGKQNLTWETEYKEVREEIDEWLQPARQAVAHSYAMRHKLDMGVAGSLPEQAYKYATKSRVLKFLKGEVKDEQASFDFEHLLNGKEMTRENFDSRLKALQEQETELVKSRATRPKGWRSRTLSEEDRVYIEYVTEKNGYTNADGFCQQILFMPSKQQAINQITRERVNERFPDIMQEREMFVEALREAIYNDDTGFLLAYEQMVVQEKASQLAEQQVKKVNRAAELAAHIAEIDNIANEMMNSYTIADALNYREFVRQERRAEREFRTASKKKDFEAAAEAKRRQEIQHKLVQLSLKKKQIFDRQIAYIKGLTKMHRTAWGKEGNAYKHFNQACVILARLGETHPEFDRESLDQSLLEYVEEMQDLYGTVEIPDWIIQNDRAPFKPIPQMTLDEFTDIVHTLQNIKAIAAAERKENFLNGKQTYQAHKDNILAELMNRPAATAYPPGQKGASEGAVEQYINSMLTSDTLGLEFDLYKEDGFFRKNWFDVLKHASDNISRAMAIHRDNAAKALEIYAPSNSRKKEVTKEVAYDVLGKDAKGNPIKVNRLFLVQVLCNLGNAGNMARLCEMPPVGLENCPLWVKPDPEKGLSREMARDTTKDNIIAFLEQVLTPEDIAYAQSKIDNASMLFEERRALEIRTKGFPPKKVTATPIAFHLKGGQTVLFKGGYYPIWVVRNLKDDEVFSYFINSEDDK